MTWTGRVARVEIAFVPKKNIGMFHTTSLTPH